MTDLTPEQIAELRALLAKVTPGEWVKHVSINGGRNVLVRVRPKGCAYPVAGMHGDYKEDHADFIAAAKNALPALLDAAEELRDRLETMECAIRHYACHQPLDLKRPSQIQSDLLTIAGDEHYHVASIGDDRCALCGNDLRHEVHKREAFGAKP